MCLRMLLRSLCERAEVKINPPKRVVEGEAKVEPAKAASKKVKA